MLNESALWLEKKELHNIQMGRNVSFWLGAYQADVGLRLAKISLTM